MFQMRTRGIWRRRGDRGRSSAAAAAGGDGAPAAPATRRHRPRRAPASRGQRARGERAGPTSPTGIGPGEGELNLVIWAGYAERGAVDPAFDWVTPFERRPAAWSTRPT